MSVFRFAVFLFCTRLLAQTSIVGSLTGIVRDPSLQAVPGAAITTHNIATGQEFTATSDSSGVYRLTQLTPGNYALKIEKAGFRSSVTQAVAVRVNEIAVVDVELAVGAVAEVVSVVADAPLVQSQTTEVSTLVDERRVRELPLNGKNFQRLITLSSGIGAGGTTNPSVNGARASMNNYSFDGNSGNDERTPNGIALNGGAATNFDGEAPNSGPNLISTEAIQEYRVISSNADATFGRGSGAQINVITKSGGNEWHGSLYQFLRNDKLDARDYFNTGPFYDDKGRAVAPPFKQNLFGGTIGGRLVRNKHFVFGNYEGYRQRLQQTSSVTLPNADLVNLIPGDLGRLYRTYFIDRNIIPSSGNPAGTFAPLTARQRDAAVNAGFPSSLFDGSLSNSEAGTVLLSTAPVRDFDQDAFLIRTDHRLSNRWTAFVRYAFAQPRNTSAVGIPDDVTANQQRWQQGSVQAILTLTPSHVFEFRGGVQRARSVSGPRNGSDQELAAIGVNAPFGLVINATGTGLTELQVRSASSFIDNQTIPQGSLQHTWTTSRLSLRSGLDIRQIQSNLANVSSGRPAYTYADFVGPNGLLGSSPAVAQPLAAAVAFGNAFGLNGGPTTPMRGWRSLHQEYFTQADWRVRPRLTLNLGVRYSYYGVYGEVNNAISNLYATDSSGQIVPEAAPFEFGRAANQIAPISEDRPLYQPDRNNWQPRVGVAWDLFGNSNSVLRAAWGMYYDRIYQIMFTGNISNAPFSVGSSTANAPFLLSASAPVAAAGSAPAITSVDPNLRSPLTHRFNVAFEQRLESNTTFTVAWVGARATDLVRNADVNGGAAVPTDLRPDPRFGRQRLILNGAESRYDALQAYVRRRFTNGVDLTAAYTFAKATDNNSTEISFGESTPWLLNQGADSSLTGVQGGGAQFVARPWDLDQGRSSFDVRHAVSASHIIELPFGRGRRWLNGAGGLLHAIAGGWNLAGIVTIRSGLPFTPTLGVDANDDGDASTDRPALVNGAALSSLYSPASSTQWLLSQAEARQRLGVPDVSRPELAIKRNSLAGPWLHQYDASIRKQFRTGERLQVGLEANAFNLLNHPNFSTPNANLSSAFFGRITSTYIGSSARQIQLGVRLRF